VLGPDHPEVARVLSSLASLPTFRRPPFQPPSDPATEALLQRALAIQEKAEGDDFFSLTNAADQLARFYEHQGKVAEAEAVYQRVLAACERRWGADQYPAARCLDALAGLYERQSRLDEAEQLHQEALGRLEQSVGPDHPALLGPLQALARLRHRSRRYAEVEAIARRCLAIHDNDPRSHPSQRLHALEHLAYICMEQAKYEEAEALFQQALARFESMERSQRGGSPLLFQNYARLLKLTGRMSEALAMERRAVDSFAGHHDMVTDARRRVVWPPPHPIEQPDFIWISTLTVGYVTEESAQIVWHTTGDAQAVSEYRGGGGGTSGGGIGRDHAFMPHFHAPVPWGEVEAFALSAPGADWVTATFAPALPATADGSPRIECETRVRALGRPDFVELEARLFNRGDADALRVQLERPTLPEDWSFLADDVGAAPQPFPIDLGRIGPGANAVWIARLLRRSGDADPAVTLYGPYTDAAGERREWRAGEGVSI
jgi:tetratricopeptide (TPR) repeat protein